MRRRRRGGLRRKLMRGVRAQKRRIKARIGIRM